MTSAPGLALLYHSYNLIPLVNAMAIQKNFQRDSNPVLGVKNGKFVQFYAGLLGFKAITCEMDNASGYKQVGIIFK